MKKLTLLISILFSALGAWVFVDYVLAQTATTYVPPVPDTSSEYAFLLIVPPPFTPQDITSRIYCPRVEARTGKLVLLSLWADLGNRTFTYAHAQATNLGKEAGWAFLITGPKVWVKLMTEIVGKLNEKSETKILGPLNLQELSKDKLCTQIASAFLITIEDLSKGGPADDGTWPKEETLLCPDSVWQLMSQMNGYKLAGQAWKIVPETASVAVKGPPDLLQCKADWSEPAIPLMKYCPAIPVDHECAK